MSKEADEHTAAEQIMADDVILGCAEKLVAVNVVVHHVACQYHTDASSVAAIVVAVDL